MAIAKAKNPRMKDCTNGIRALSSTVPLSVTADKLSPTRALMNRPPSIQYQARVLLVMQCPARKNGFTQVMLPKRLPSLRVKEEITEQKKQSNKQEPALFAKEVTDGGYFCFI